MLYPHFTADKTEYQRGKVTPRSYQLPSALPRGHLIFLPVTCKNGPMGGNHREAGLNFTKTSLPPTHPGRSCMRRQPSQNIKHRLIPPVQAGRGHRLRFPHSCLCMLVLFSVFLPEGSLTWARWPGPGYKSPSALPEETVGLLARGLGRPAL